MAGSTVSSSANHRGADPEKAALLAADVEKAPDGGKPSSGGGGGKGAHKDERILGVPAVVVAGVCYCLASTAMVRWAAPLLRHLP